MAFLGCTFLFLLLMLILIFITFVRDTKDTTCDRYKEVLSKNILSKRGVKYVVCAMPNKRGSYNLEYHRVYNDSYTVDMKIKIKNVSMEQLVKKNFSYLRCGYETLRP